VSDWRAWRLRPADDVLARELGDDIVLLRLGDAAFFGLVERSAVLWRILMRNETAGSAVIELAAQLQAPVAACEQEVQTFIATLREHGLVRADLEGIIGHDAALPQAAAQGTACEGLIRYGDARQFTDCSPVRPGARSHR
jgi:hypothetical protein